MPIGCEIVPGSHPLGGPLTSDVKDDFDCCRVRCVVMCSGHDPVRTCTLEALHNFCIIIPAFRLQGNKFSIMESGILIGLLIDTSKEGIPLAGGIELAFEVKGAIGVLGRLVQPPDDQAIICFVLRCETCIIIDGCTRVFSRSPFPVIARNRCVKYREIPPRYGIGLERVD